MGVNAILPLLLGIWALAGTPARATVQPDPLKAAQFDQRLDARIPLALGFRDESGQAVPLARYFGRTPVVLSLVYFDCPNLCTYVLNGQVKSFLALPYALGADFSALSISIDPHETPSLARAKKATYLKRYAHPGSGAGWHFLTGDEATIRRLADAVGFHYAYDRESRQYAHPSGIVVLTPDGQVSRYLYGIEYDPIQLKLALMDASRGRIGTPIDQVLLRCYHYDPKAGRYSLVVINVLQGAGIATALLLAGLIGSMLVLERRRRAAHAKLGPGERAGRMTP